MDQPFIAVSSITYALKGRDLLRKMGFGAYVERTPEHQNRTGCGYGIYVRGDAAAAEHILRQHGVRVLQRRERPGAV